MSKHYGQAGQDEFVLLMTGSKRGGWYIEIGSNHPITHSNTYLLEKQYRWKGLMVEMVPSFAPSYRRHRPLAIPVIGDACRIAYRDLLETHAFPSDLDYLQIDLDVENGSTRRTLELLDRTILPDHRFGVVTFEHDIYRGDFFDTRSISRSIFERHGYIRVFDDVAVFFEKKWCPFEDWYAHPSLVDATLIQHILGDPRNKSGQCHDVCLDIVRSALDRTRT